MEKPQNPISFYLVNRFNTKGKKSLRIIERTLLISTDSFSFTQMRSSKKRILIIYNCFLIITFIFEDSYAF